MKNLVFRENNFVARGLGWFSIGLGAAEILAPRQLSDMIGVDGHPMLMRILGLREIASGIGILADDHPVVPLWSRVAGDGMDLALLASAVPSARSKTRALAAIAAVAGVTALDALCSIVNTAQRGSHLAKSAITINQSQDAVY